LEFGCIVLIVILLCSSLVLSDNCVPCDHEFDPWLVRMEEHQLKKVSPLNGSPYLKGLVSSFRLGDIMANQNILKIKFS